MICEKTISNNHRKTTTETRMWAHAQRDGLPAKCMWRPLLNAVDQMTDALWKTSNHREKLLQKIVIRLQITKRVNSGQEKSSTAVELVNECLFFTGTKSFIWSVLHTVLYGCSTCQLCSWFEEIQFHAEVQHTSLDNYQYAAVYNEEFPAAVTSSSVDSELSSSITPSLFHSRLKKYLIHKSFPP